MRCLSYKDVEAIHELVIDEKELQGIAANRSLEAVLSRVDNRIAFGMIDDVFALAACYACYLSVGHVLNDANKRTAFACMDTCLALNNIELDYAHTGIGDLIIQAAQGLIDDTELASWLRGQHLLQEKD